MSESKEDVKEKEENNENTEEKIQEKEEKEIEEIKEENNKEKDIDNIKEKILNSKNDFLLKMKNMIETISNNYDNIISKIDQNSNEESLNILNNLEELQNNILESNENLNIYLNKKEEKEDEKENILKINCNSDINKIQRKLEKNNYEKIIIKELSSESFNEIFQENKNKAYNDVIIKKSNIENYDIKQAFNDINKLKIKKCKILFGSNFFNFKKINELYLESINLINENLDIILQGIKANINDLKIFSIKNNNISKLNLNFEENIKYNNLVFLNVSNNKINKIKENIFDILPNIKAIDLTNNNINFLCRYKNIFNKNKNCILLLAKNPAIIKEKNREEYCQYLKEILPNNNNCIKYLNLEGLFINKTYPILSEINFNNVDIINLNLSHNNLNDEDFIKLIKNNKEFFAKIKKLILCSNYITEEGINSLINIESEDNTKIFINLRKLDLSGNHINFSDLSLLKKIINFFPNLNTLLLKYTPFEKEFNNYLKMKITNKIEETKENKENKEIIIDAQFEELFEKEKFLYEKKLKIKMMNMNKYEDYNLIRKYFPYLLCNIILENKFIE